MKKLVLILVLALGGCARQVQEFETAIGVVTGATITANQVYIAANAFDAIEASATNYLKLPLCGKLPCRSAGAVAVIVPAIRSGRLARNKLEAAVNTSNGAPIDANLFNTLVSSTNTLKSILAEYGVN